MAINEENEEIQRHLRARRANDGALSLCQPAAPSPSISSHTHPSVAKHVTGQGFDAQTPHVDLQPLVGVRTYRVWNDSTRVAFNNHSHVMICDVCDALHRTQLLLVHLALMLVLKHAGGQVGRSRAALRRAAAESILYKRRIRTNDPPAPWGRALK